MPWPVYTERLLYGKSETGWTVFTVPDGKRAVIKCVTVTDANNASGHIQVEAHGVMIALAVFPASWRFTALEMTAVVYERETIQAFRSAAGIDFMVAGYLFDDQVGAPPPPAETKPTPPERPTPVPTGSLS